jgi:hypothetical protein
MLTIDLGTIEYFDSDKQEFVYETGGIVRFEYTLKAIYEWEGIYKRPFLKGELTYTELIDFYRLMALDEFDVKFLNAEHVKRISDYIADPKTATTFSDNTGAKGTTQAKNKINTAEELYAMMFSAGIPLDFENRNLNRLITLLKVISVQNNPPKKMTREETLKQNYNLNKQRREQMKTNG